MRRATSLFLLRLSIVSSLTGFALRVYVTERLGNCAKTIQRVLTSTILVRLTLEPCLEVSSHPTSLAC